MTAGTQPNSPPVSPSLDAQRAVVVSLLLVLCATAYSFHFLSFLHAKEAVLLLGLCTLSALAVLDKSSVLSGITAYRPLWALLAWAATVHLLFGRTQVPAYSAQELTRLAVLLLVAAQAYPLFKQPPWRARLCASIIAAASLVALLGLIQYWGILTALFPVFPEYDQRIYSVFGNQDLLGGFLAIGLPLAVHRFFNKPRPAPLIHLALLLLLVALALSGSRTAWLAAFIGVTLVVPYRTIDRKKAGLLASGCVLLVALLCVLAPDSTYRRLARPFSEGDVGGRARLWFWDSTARMIADAPLTGHGLGNYPYWSPLYQGEALHAPGAETHYQNEIHTLHAHSDPLELAAEAGLPAFFFIFWMFWRIRKGRGPEWGGLAAFGTFALFNATYQSAPHALCALLLAGSLLADASPQVPEPPRRRYPAMALAAAALLVTGFTIFAVLIPSYRMGSVADAYREGRPIDNLFEELTEYPWPNPQANQEWATYLEAAGRYPEAERHALAAKEGLDTGNIYLLLGALAEQKGDEEAAKHAYEACLLRWPRNTRAWSRLVPLLSPDERANKLTEAARWLPPQDLASLR